MSKSSIPQKLQSAIWARAGGRCQYRGCNVDLVGDLIAGRRDGLYGFIAHIVADSTDGPRGDPIRSPQLAKDLSNLMLMCGRHHKLIDVDQVAEHPEELLLPMKAAHESRMALVASIDEERSSHVLRFCANIGQNEALVSKQAIFSAMAPDRFPESDQTIDLELLNLAMTDGEQAYWTTQAENLRRQFAAKVSGRIERQEIRHVSVFALAPQPLLIELGRLLCDIVPVATHQRHREPSSWRWACDSKPVTYLSSEPIGQRDGPVVLKLGVSATVTDDRIEAVLGSEPAIWSLSADAPGNDIVRHPEDQASYRRLLRSLFDRIKAKHGTATELHVFPAVPASLAIETGRVWMPKADLPMLVYDQQPGRGFVPTLRIA